MIPFSGIGYINYRPSRKAKKNYIGSSKICQLPKELIMALVVGQKSKKSLELRAERKSFTNPETKQVKEYNSYYVVVNGIPIMLQVPPKDNTARAILENYFCE